MELKPLNVDEIEKIGNELLEKDPFFKPDLEKYNREHSYYLIGATTMLEKLIETIHKRLGYK